MNPSFERMKFNATAVLVLLLIAGTLTAAFGQAAVDKKRFEGVWKWTFTMPDGGEVTPQIKFTLHGDKLAGTTRFRPGSDAPLANILLQGDQVSFEVVRERDGERIITRYRGGLSGHVIKGRIITKANGVEQSHAWEARRVGSVEGAWKWPTVVRNQPMDSKINLKLEDDRLTGKMTGIRGIDYDLHRGLFRDGQVSFETERIGRDGEKYTNRYYGKFSGDRIVGKMETSAAGAKHTNDWNAVRAE